MSKTTVGAVRSFFRALADGRDPTPAQYNAVLVVTRGSFRDADQHREAVQDLLVTTIAATKAGKAASAGRLLELDDQALVGVVRHRVRQHCVGSSPRWPLLKALREHVARALRNPLTAIHALPVSLLVGTKISGRAVAEAIGFLLQEDRDLPRTVGALSQALMDRYFSETAAPETPAPSEVEEFEHHRDAMRCAAGIQSVLGDDLVRLIRQRHAGKGYGEIADAEGAGTATVHGRIQKAIGRARRHVLARGTHPDTGRAALKLLAG